MARTEKEIISSIASDVKSINETVDTKKGAIYNFVIAPMAPTINEVETSVERVERLLSLDMVNASENTNDISAFGNNFKVARGGGKKERHLQCFYLFSIPITTVEIPTGTLVSSSEGTYTYKVISGNSFIPSNSSSYYNSETGRYELNLMVEAVNYGDGYNLPKGRVNKLVSSVSVDGTISVSESLVEGGSEETDTEYMAKVEQRFNGLNSGTSSGIVYTINDSLGISDVKIFKPGDDLFTRKVKRAALDIYVNRVSEKCVVQTETMEYETTTITLNSKPATRVDSVTVDGESVSFVFNQDTSVDYYGSSNSNDTITIDAVEKGSIVVITYYVNEDVSNANDLFTEKDLYDSDILIRQPFVVYLNLEVLIKTNTVNKATAQEEALEAIANFPSYTMGEVLYPSDLEDALKKTIPNMIGCYIIKHNIDGQIANISTVSLNANSIINVDNAVVKVL